MMYSEFAEAVGCKDNDHNHKVFRELEIIYMNSDCTKEHIYEMGRKLVDNSKTEKKLALEAEVKAEIENVKSEIESAKGWVSYYKTQKEYNKSVQDKFWETENRRMERYYRDEIKKLRNRIAALKWVLA